MAKNKEKEFDTINDGSHAIRKFTIGDFLIILILVILCATCVLPFVHLAAKSVSSNTAVMQKAVVLWPIGFNLDAYNSIFQDGTLVHSFLYSVEVVLIFTVLGMIAGAAFCHNFKLVSSADGPTGNGKIAVLIGFVVVLLVSLFFTRKAAKEE